MVPPSEIQPFQGRRMSIEPPPPPSPFLIGEGRSNPTMYCMHFMECWLRPLFSGEGEEGGTPPSYIKSTTRIHFKNNYVNAIIKVGGGGGGGKLHKCQEFTSVRTVVWPAKNSLYSVVLYCS